MTKNQLTQRFDQFIQEAMTATPVDNEALVLQLTLGLIHTLIAEERLSELYLMLSVQYAAYFPIYTLLVCLRQAHINRDN